MPSLWTTLLGLLLLISGSTAYGETAPKNSLAMASDSFLSFHPDIRWRNEGMELYDQAKFAAAFKLLLKSASFAEKSAQAMIAEMHWTGTGTALDKPLGYAWMDLAAERNYDEFVVLREHYWSKLSELERAQALKVGKDVYANFGDDVAKPRLKRKLDRGRRETTGSRTGFVGAMNLYVRVDGGFLSISGEEYYADEFWKAADYFKWKDRVWQESRKGQVDVGLPTAANKSSPTEPDGN